MAAKSSNSARYSNKLGKNVAPNVLSLFLRPSFVTSDQDQLLPLFSNPLYFSAAQAQSGSFGSSRLLLPEPSDRLTSRLQELTDEGGVAPSTIHEPFAFNSTDLIVTRPNSIASSFNMLNDALSGNYDGPIGFNSCFRSACNYDS